MLICGRSPSPTRTPYRTRRSRSPRERSPDGRSHTVADGEFVRGVVLASRVRQSRAHTRGARPMLVVEVEIAFRFDPRLAGASAPYAAAEIAGAVTPFAAIEVVDSRFRIRGHARAHRMAGSACRTARSSRARPA